jgi:poly(3-hydroxyalkanoate) depolymerase
MARAANFLSWRPRLFRPGVVAHGRLREAVGARSGSPHSAVFTEIMTLDVASQSVRVGIRHGRSSLPPLLIFNGIGANLELLEPFVAALKGIEIVVFDVPGVGGSPAPRLPYRYSRIARLTNRLLVALGYGGQVDVLGLSWGGMLAQQYAYLNPDRCRRLILAATSPGSIMLPGHFSAVRKLTNPRRHSDPEYFWRIAPELYGGSFRHDPNMIERHIDRIQPPRELGYFYQLSALWGWTSMPWLHRLRQPTLIMAGTEDPIVPLANAKILAHFIRRSELFTIDDGHLFLITRAGEVVSAVKRFLTKPIDKGLDKISSGGIPSRLARLARRLRLVRSPGR